VRLNAALKAAGREVSISAPVGAVAPAVARAALPVQSGNRPRPEALASPAEDTDEAMIATMGDDPATESITGSFDGASAWPDEGAESAFIAEARQRGEPVKATAATIEVMEEKDTKALPTLSELVKRLSPEVRETLDELFRAKFTAVRKVPKKFFKTEGEGTGKSSS
jgi:hypothetical protein